VKTKADSALCPLISHEPDRLARLTGARGYDYKRREITKYAQEFADSGELGTSKITIGSAIDLYLLVRRFVYGGFP
jgi:hypothetical protein